MAKSTKGMTKNDVLESVIADIRKSYGDGSIMVLGEEPVRNVPVISTGIFPVDSALGIGGLPRGRITEIFGKEGSGKTTIALHAVAEAQKNGGTAAFIDAEHALDPILARKMGVDIKSLIISQPDSGEQALDILEKLVKSCAVDVIVVDSVAALSPRAEIEGQIGDQSVGLQARLMSFALRKLTSAISTSKTVVIFINQLRSVINRGYGHGPTEDTTGGRALKFYSSVRLDVKRGKQITRGDNAIGHELFVKVVKNKLSPPFRTAHMSLMYGRGIPDTIAAVDLGIDIGLIKKKGSWLAYKGETLGQGKETVAAYLDQHPELLKEIKDTILSADTTELEYDMSPEDNAAAAIPDAGEEEDNILLDDEE